MTFSISVSRIIESIYAASAMYALISSHSEPPRLLHRDHRAMLDKGVRHAFSHVCLRLLPFVDDCSLSDDEVLTLELSLPAGFPSTGYRPVQLALEDAVTCEALARAYAGYDSGLSDRNASTAAESLRRIRSSLSGPCDATLSPSLL